MKQYVDLVNHVLETGIRKENRTGVDTIAQFGYHYNVDLAEGFPLLTTKEVHFKSVIIELLWFLRGDTNIKYLKDNGVSIWDEWADEEGEIPSGYGTWWRNFPSAVKNPGGFYDIHKVDQIGYVVEQLKVNPTSRRLVVTAWNPGHAYAASLPPCHYTFVFGVLGGRLNCHLTQRSCDIALGVPFNLASYAALTQIIAQQVGLGLGVFSHTLVDAHIYTSKADGSMAEYDHVPGLREQVAREPRPLPTLKIADKPFDELEYEDFTLENYNPHPKIKFKVAV